MSDVIAKLTYNHDDGQRPWLYARNRTRKDKHDEDYGGSPDLVNVMIRNGRNHDLRLDQHGFELVPCETSVSNFSNDREVEQSYYPEIERLIRETTGASKVVCIHHQVRNGQRGKGSANKNPQQYATDVHTDTSPSDAQHTFWETLASLGKQDASLFQKGRFLYINAWRNIDEHNPIMDNHLALCDETSLIKPDDYIPYDFFDEGYDGCHYYLSSQHALTHHRWYYFPGMTKNEVVLFKQYESDPTRTARMCFHCSFADPKADTNTPPRRSIEVRCMAFFPYHQPNTCPPTPDETKVRVTVSALLVAVQYVNEWPRTARWWFVDRINKGAFQEVLEEFVVDKDNDLGMKKASKEMRAAVRERAMQEGFKEVSLQAAAALSNK